MQTVCTFNTRLAKGADATQSTVTFDWSGVTDDQLRELATRSIVIATQAMYRTAEMVPKNDTVKVAELLKRERGGFKLTPETAIKKLADMKLTPEQKAYLLKMAQS